MIGLKFEFKDGKIHILDYPTADKVLELPDTMITKQLKDVLLHQFDLNRSVECMHLVNSQNPQLINTALVHEAIINYYKCFGNNVFIQFVIGNVRLGKQKADELINRLSTEYKPLGMDDFRSMNEMQYRVPTNSDVFEKG